jgi:hypothetical protein
LWLEPASRKHLTFRFQLLDKLTGAGWQIHSRLIPDRTTTHL